MVLVTSNIAVDGIFADGGEQQQLFVKVFMNKR